MAFLLLAACLLAVLAPDATAQTQPDVASQLRQIEADVRSIDGRTEKQLSDVERGLLRGRLATARQSAAAVSKQVAGELTAIDARIAELGAAPAGAKEAPEVRQRRASLTAERLSLDASSKRARLLEVEAEQLAADLERAQAEAFDERMSRRVSSPLLPAFWGAVIESFDQDLARIGRFLGDGQRQAGTAGHRRGIVFALLGLVLAAVLIGPGRRAALGLGQRYLISDAPGQKLRRSAYAMWVMFVSTLAPVLGALALVAGAGLSNLLPRNWNPLLEAFVAATGFAAFTTAVFGALLMRRKPSWRLAPIGDAVAQRLRPLTWILAAITFLGLVVEAFNKAIGASEAAVAATLAIEASGGILLIGGGLLAVGRIHAAEVDREEVVATNPGLSALALVLWLVLLVASLAFAAGYIEFSSFLVSMIVWASVVCAATYLIMHFVDDGLTGLFNRESKLGRTAVRGVGLRSSAIDQFGVLASGVVRVCVGLLALVLLAVPFGAGNGVWSTFDQIASVAGGIEIGGVAISPGAIVRGIVVLIIGLALVRGFMAWLDNRYLPATDLDGSGRNSVSLIARYVGLALAAIWALASLGIGVERIALLLSALSVGIGFGLQAITQNFISGLILLAERPIKIGDLIKVGLDEGDVKRISVRSTEIELADHSTLIVPNSELITKSVLNKTLASPLGRVQIQFSVPIEADAARVEQIVLDAYAQQPEILDDPAPSVFIDSIVDARIVFNSFAHVSGPRAAYGARSAVYKTLLQRLREEGIPIGTTPQRLELLDTARTLSRDREGHAE